MTVVSLFRLSPMARFLLLLRRFFLVLKPFYLLSFLHVLLFSKESSLVSKLFDVRCILSDFTVTSRHRFPLLASSRVASIYFLRSHSFLSRKDPI